MQDHFPVTINAAHIVAVSETVTLETSDTNVTKVVSRGVYSFSNYKEARHFKTVINEMTEQATATLYSRNKEGTDLNEQ